MFAKGKRFTLRSNASRRIYPALHVGLQRKPTQMRGTLPLRCRGKTINLSYPYSRSERFTFAKGKRFTLRSNASCRIYPALHVGLQRKPTQKRGTLPLRCRGIALGGGGLSRITRRAAADGRKNGILIKLFIVSRC